MEQPTVRWTEVDGVQVVHADEPGPLRASLAFRIGKTDEYLHANGITHIAEHLALFALGQPPHYQNGSVRTCFTTFDTVGDEQQVVDFVSGVCEALSRLDGERLDSETRVLEVEARQRGRSMAHLLYQWRYGAGGPGLWGFDEYAIHTASPSSVQLWADQVFRAGNAVLILSAAPPAGLRVPLPPGGWLPVPALAPVLPETPAQLLVERPSIGGLAVVDRTVAASAATQLLGRRLVERLRRDLAVSYSPAAEYDRYDAETAHVLIEADIHPDHLDAATAALHAVVEDLAVNGVTEAELAGYLDESRRSLVGLSTSGGMAYVEALAWLLSGERTPWDAHWAETEALTPADLVAPAVQMRDSMLYAVPSGSQLDDVPRAPMSSVQPELAGTPLTRTEEAAPGSQLFESPEGVEHRWADGTRVTVRYDTCRATLAWPSGSRVLIGPDGTAVAVEPRAWIESRRLIGHIDDATRHVLVGMPGEVPNTPPQQHGLGWQPALFLAIVCLLGGLGLARIGSVMTDLDGTNAALIPVGLAISCYGVWLVRFALREKRKARAARE
jgi:hypothetical protein